MKKIFVLLFSFLLLCGCASEKSTSPIVDNISFTATINYNDTVYECNAEILHSNISLSLLKPNDIKDLIIKIDDNSITTEFFGVNHTYSLDSLPHGALARLILVVIDDVSNKTIEHTEGNGELCGFCDEYNYKFVFSPSGTPLLLEINELNFSMEFKNIVLK